LSISAFAVKRPVTVLMMVLAISVIGIMSYLRTPVDLLPEMTFPGAAVVISLPGAAPQEVESLLTRPVESALATVSKVREISSSSREGSSIVMVSFDWGTNMDFAALEMREKLDMVQRYLPAEVSAPMVLKFDPSLQPILNIALASTERTLSEVRSLAEETIMPRLERLEGVAAVTVSGGMRPAIQVKVDPEQLERFDLSLSQVANAARGGSVNIPGGRLETDGQDYLIRSVLELNSLSDLQNLVIGMRRIQTITEAPVSQYPSAAYPHLGGGMVRLVPIYLHEVATIEKDPILGQGLSRLNTVPSITLSVQKRSDSNTVLVAHRVKDELSKLSNDYPDLNVLATMDQSSFIDRAIDTVQDSALLGAALAVAVLFVFLRSVTSTLVIALAVPVSVIATFALIYFGGLTLNLMTLSGLALGIGMLVDNSIVVLESIFRRQEAGESREVAARKGAEEVAMAITASTLTTVAVFLPVAFVGGITGTLFKELALSVSFSLLASLGVALMVVPMLSATLLTARARKRARSGIYERSLSLALRHKWAGLLLVALSIASSIVLYPSIGGEFIPPFEQSEFTVRVVLPTGSTVGQTVEITSEVEDYLLSMPEVESVATSIAGSSPMMGSQGESHRATLNVVLDPGTLSGTLVNRINERYKDQEYAQVTAGTMSIGGMVGATGSQVQILLSGPSLEGLQEYSALIKQSLADIAGIRDVTDNMGTGLPELVVRLKREEVAKLGFPAVAVGSLIRLAFQGETVARLTQEGRELDVNLRLTEHSRANVEDLENLLIASSGGRPIRLRDISSISHEVGPANIARRSNARYVTISAAVVGRDLQSVQGDIDGRISALAIPESYRVEYGGDLREMQEAFAGLTTALLLAVALVYMVMASQFESLVYPLIVMLSLPLAAAGVLGVLYLAGKTFSVPSIIGIIMLAGIVVNNAIVLVDYTNQLRRQGKALREAIIEGAATRLRPILMTAATTILALLPLAFRGGPGAELQQPLGLAVIGGLLVSTLLTLYVIPMAYETVTERIKK
jgi:HAE1 family hydrophobic/amphiphilic exporter-1